MKAMRNDRVYLRALGIIVALAAIARCSGNNASNQSGTAPVEFPTDAVAGQNGMIELTVPAVAVSVSSTPPNAVVCDTTLVLNSGGEGINCAFGAVGSGSASVTVSVTTASGQTSNYTVTGNISLPAAPLTQDTFSVAITNPSSSTVSTVTNSSTSGNMPTTMMQMSTPVSLTGSVIASGSIESIAWGDGTTQTITAGTTALTHTYPKPGAYTVTVAAAGNGAAGSLSVALQVECNDTIPPMVASASPITATVNSGSDNLYNFTANITGGSGSFTTLWAPDGTGVFRDPVATGLDAQYYADYPGTRNVQAVVTDVACGNQLPISQSITFNIPIANGTPGQLQGPQVGNISFIQGNLASTTASTASDLRMNSMLSVLQAASDPLPDRVQGNYQLTSPSGSSPYPGSFNESAFTTINDNKDGLQLNAAFDSSGNMTISSVTVYVSGNTELGSLLADAYTTTSCTARGTVTVLMGSNPCTSGNSSNVAIGFTIDYTYSCPVLTDPAGNTIALTQGAGYYVMDTSNGTCGGGGQGGGTAPQPF